MSLEHVAKIAGLLAEKDEYRRRLIEVLDRMDRLPERDVEGLRKLAASASLNASDLMGTMNDLADEAHAAECEIADRAHDSARKLSRSDAFSFINLHPQGSAL